MCLSQVNQNSREQVTIPITTEMVVISRIITSRTMVDIHSLQTILIRITITMLHQMTLLSIGDLDDFEEVLTDDGVPF